ncbi:MAG: glycoside hydrolase family 3 N-terminal domain-containing protein [Sciscionella sp.]
MPPLGKIRRPILTTFTVVTLASLNCAAPSAAATTQRTPQSQRTVNNQFMNPWVTTAISRMSLSEKVGQLFTTYVHGTDANTPDAKNTSEFGVSTPTEVVAKYHLGGVIYFQNDQVRNIDNPRQVAELSNGLQRAAMTSGSGVPLNICTDQEEGIVTRIGSPATEFPGSMALGAGRRTQDARKAAEITGSEMRAMGINLNNAPDADVNSNPANPVIGVRSFGSDPGLVSKFVTTQVKGYQQHVAATAKHFPGHGDAAADSHTGLPVIQHTKAQWEKLDAPPFRAAIAAGVDVIMTAHLSFPKIDPSGEPATLSPTILTGLLRDELHYNGVVTTDSLEMQGVRTLHPDAELPVLALKAGADVMLMPAKLGVAINSVLDAVRKGKLSQQRIDTSVERVLKQKYRSGVITQPLVDPARVDHAVGTKAHLAAARRITDRTVTALRDDANLLPINAAPSSALVTGWGDTTTSTLAKQLGEHGSTTTALATGANPSDAQIAAAVAAAKQSKLVVDLTNGLGSDPQQRKLLDQLSASGTPVVAVAVRNPYDAGYNDTAKTWLATYSSTAVSTEALSKVIFGEISPSGKLPVDIPDGADPSKVRYHFGFGLHW